MVKHEMFLPIEAPAFIRHAPLDLSIVIRCGRDKNGLIRFLTSVNENVEVVVSAAEDASFIHEFQEKGYKIAPHTYGNWSSAAQAGINASTNNDVIIMDSDSVFGEGAINTIDKALKDGHLLVQPRIIFMDNGTPLSKIIAQARTYENRRVPKSYSPGLGLKVQELTERIGVGGNVYNLSVAYGDDGDLDQRRRNAGIDVYVAEDALIYSDPNTLEHELKTAYRFGIGERQSQQGKTNQKNIVDIMNEEFFSKEAKEYYMNLIRQFGIPTAMFMMFCRSAYVTGFQTAGNIKTTL